MIEQEWSGDIKWSNDVGIAAKVQARHSQSLKESQVDGRVRLLGASVIVELVQEMFAVGEPDRVCAKERYQVIKG
ncbi:hypothetical protein SLA2020_186430 [Shorea laevis]